MRENWRVYFAGSIRQSDPSISLVTRNNEVFRFLEKSGRDHIFLCHFGMLDFFARAIKSRKISLNPPEGARMVVKFLCK